MRPIARLQHWLANQSRKGEATVAYVLSCPAGHTVRGLRQRKHQVVGCGECGRSVFILASSAWPSVERFQAARESSTSPWRWPIIAAVLTVVVVAAALVALFTMLRPQVKTSDNIATHLEAGEQALREGRMRRAAEEFDHAEHLLSQNAASLPLGEVRTLRRLQREANLLADLLSEPLEDILLHAARSQEDEWQAQFQQRYKGPGKANAVGFALEVHRNGAGRYDHDWHLSAGDEPARVELSDLTMLQGLPLDQPRLLLFGARLGKVAREQNGVWVIRFEPDSGVLLTNLEAARACCPPVMYEELPELLEQQRQWLEEK